MFFLGRPFFLIAFFLLSFLFLSFSIHYFWNHWNGLRLGKLFGVKNFNNIWQFQNLHISIFGVEEGYSSFWPIFDAQLGTQKDQFWAEMAFFWNPFKRFNIIIPKSQFF